MPPTKRAGLAPGTIRLLNSTNPDSNAWARFERSEISADEFCLVFDAEAATLGYAVDGAEVLASLGGIVRPAMVEALRRITAVHRTALLTNNIVSAGPRSDEMAAIMALFDVVVESSKVGMRKPEPGFYLHACAELGVEPADCVFLDDLGINLKPAKALGMQTIKVIDPDDALAELEQIVGFALH